MGARAALFDRMYGDAGCRGMRSRGQRRRRRLPRMAPVRGRRRAARDLVPSAAGRRRARARIASAATVLRRTDCDVLSHRLAGLLQPGVKGAAMTATGGARMGSPIRRIIARLLFAAVLLVDIVLGAYVVSLYYLHPRTDDAYVRANIVNVAPQVSGTIIELPLRDDQHVRAGDLLFAIDPRPYQAELELAQAQLSLTNLQIEALERGIRAARAREHQAQAAADYQQ